MRARRNRRCQQSQPALPAKPPWIPTSACLQQLNGPAQDSLRHEHPRDFNLKPVRGHGRPASTHQSRDDRKRCRLRSATSTCCSPLVRHEETTAGIRTLLIRGRRRPRCCACFGSRSYDDGRLAGNTTSGLERRELKSSLSLTTSPCTKRSRSEPSARPCDAVGGGQFSSVLRSRSSHGGPDIPEGSAVSDLHIGRLPLRASRDKDARSLLRKVLEADGLHLIRRRVHNIADF